MALSNNENSQNDDPFEAARLESRLQFRRSVQIIFSLVLIIAAIFTAMNWTTIKTLAWDGLIEAERYVQQWLPHEDVAPNQPVTEVPAGPQFQDVHMEDLPYEEPKVEDGRECRADKQQNIRFLFAGGTHVDFVTSEKVEIRHYSSGSGNWYETTYLEVGKAAVLQNGLAVTNCGDGLFINQIFTLTIEIVYPVTEWKHIDGCTLEKYVSTGTDISTDKTTLLGMQEDERGDYTLYITQSDGNDFAIDLSISTGRLSYFIYNSVNSLPIDQGGWAYEFKGETLVGELSNGDIIFLYIPWEGGYPDEYLYYVGSSIEDGGCLP